MTRAEKPSLPASNSNGQERLHGLDALRAFMMILGVVLHSGIAYSPDSSLVTDPPESPLVNAAITIIHIYRLPIFFFLAGFFAHHIFAKRKLRAFAIDRTQRILMPLVLAMPVFTLLNSFAYLFAAGVIRRGWPQNITELEYLLLHAQEDIPPWISLGLRFDHLWFLYYLYWIYIITFILLWLFQSIPISRALRFMCCTWLRILFIFPIYIIYYNSPFLSLEATETYIPDPTMFFFYGYLFFLGWLYWPHRSYLTAMPSRTILLLRMTLIFLLVNYYLSGLEYGLYTAESDTEHSIAALATSLILWEVLWFSIGFAQRIFNRRTETIRYISDASYWIYLIHLPIVCFFVAFFSTTQLLPEAKFLLVSFWTFLVSLMTYRLFVRQTFLGIMLNGRRK